MSYNTIFNDKLLKTFCLKDKNVRYHRFNSVLNNRARKRNKKYKNLEVCRRTVIIYLFFVKIFYNFFPKLKTFIYF